MINIGDLVRDFVEEGYSLEDEAIRVFIQKMNCIDGILIETEGDFEELKQQDYHGKRVNIVIKDSFGNVVKSNIDLGVHKNFEIEQEEYCFDVCMQEDGASLLINSKEQMMVEKLRSLLKFGPFSTRYKDVFDIMYLKDIVKVQNIKKCLAVYIYNDKGMRENNINDIRNRIQFTFSNKQYMKNLRKSDKNWLELPVYEVTEAIYNFFVRKELE